LHGRGVERRSVVEMAPAIPRNTVVDGRAPGPDPRRQRACSRSLRRSFNPGPGSASARSAARKAPWRGRSETESDQLRAR